MIAMPFAKESGYQWLNSMAALSAASNIYQELDESDLNRCFPIPCPRSPLYPLVARFMILDFKIE